MNYTTSPLTMEHNNALLALAHATDTGSDLFVVDRSPDFFRLGESWGESRYTGLWRRGRLIGCFGVTRQVRFLNGREEPVFYLHDVRIHPDYTGTRAFQRLAGHAVENLRQTCRWVFAVVWDSSRHRSPLTRANSVFPPAVPIGRTVHLGVPLFWPVNGDWARVCPIDGEEAWSHYERWAAGTAFAYADRARFLRRDGWFLGLHDGGKLRAVCKVIDQSAERRLVVTRSLPLPLRLIHAACRWRGTASLPGPGEPFPHAYLAYYACADGEDGRRAFFAYLARFHRQEYPYVFAGVSPELAETYRHPLFIKLGSTAYAYGDVPPGLALDARELTLL
jgi:hypothetical protein